MPEFPERLDEALQDAKVRGLSQNAVAHQIGATSPSRLSEWKDGKGSPTVEELVRLAHTLDVRLEWLAAGVPPKVPVAPEEMAYRLEIIGVVSDLRVEMDERKAQKIRAVLSPSSDVEKISGGIADVVQARRDPPPDGQRNASE